MNSNTIKVITFDLDDTLWHVEPVLLAADEQVYFWLQQAAPKLTAVFDLPTLTQWRREIYQQQPSLAHQISQLRITAVGQALEWVGYSPAQAASLSQTAFELFLECRHQVTFFDSVKPLLEKLSKHYKLGVLTNGNADIFKLEMGEFFDFSFSAEQLNASKPAADHFMAAQHYCQAQPQQMLHIGDHLDHDVRAAKSAGWHAIWYNPQLNKNNTTADIQVSCLADIPDAVAAVEAK